MGYSGIPQDSRMLFKSLSLRDDIELTGLIMPTQSWVPKLKIPNHLSSEKEKVSCVAKYFSVCLNDSLQDPDRLSRIRSIVKNIFGRYSVYQLENSHWFDSIWRKFFSKTLLPNDYKLIKNQKFAITNYSHFSHYLSVKYPFYTPIIDASEYDYVIFHEAKSIKVIGAKKIIRFHDVIPLTHPDLINDSINYVSNVFQAVKSCLGDSQFVCNSSDTEKSLKDLFETEGKKMSTAVAYCTMGEQYGSIGMDISLDAILSTRVSSLMKTSKKIEIGKGGISSNNKFRYILSVSTLERRKNFVNLVRAWRLLRETDPSIKLILVGNPGFQHKEILTEIGRDFSSGDIIHLEAVPTHELEVLYKNADCFCFVSYCEGFGYTPLEAFSCGAKLVISDLDVFRETIGDIAEYVNPNDVYDIYKGMKKSLDKENPNSEGDTDFLTNYQCHRTSKSWLDILTK